MFGRKKNKDGSDDLEQYALSEEDQAREDAELLAIIDEQEAEAAQQPAELARPQGPWDEADEPDDDVQRLDLGALRLPVPDGVEVRVDVSPEGEVVAATVVLGESAMQMNVFAAPKRSGIWGEVRSEIAEALTSGGGAAREESGPFGPELHAQVPTEAPGQGTVLAPARFVGVDGPRWFLRALVTGPAATDMAAGAPLEAVLRGVVVVRGAEAMAVRDALPLHLPAEVAEQAAEQQAAQQGLEMPERGPEITETR